MEKMQLYLIIILFQVLDTWGKPPAGVLLGNLNWAGAYRECSSIEGMKYCAAHFKLSNVNIVLISNNL